MAVLLLQVVLVVLVMLVVLVVKLVVAGLIVLEVKLKTSSMRRSDSAP